MTNHRQCSTCWQCAPGLKGNDVVGCLNACNMMVVINTDSHCVLAASSITRMPLKIENLVVKFVWSLYCACLLISESQGNIAWTNWQSTRFGFWNVCKARMTHVYAQMNYKVLPCSYWNQKILTHTKQDIPITFCRDMLSIITYCAGSAEMIYKLIHYIHLNPFPV